ncbi:zinc finger CCCH domain-containing protein 38 isoform X1 [Cucurbita moschata]|uniref:Zinc finger CCCH domain-containing protein 38 isoform X1 n=1 Tax=Cucurbita moschata TaxID=3662 RepID=A0A6J1GEA4_CUCMO|nr:zinc finger CCCH domain-containing protein 38 isoform X1 [Cucurbita moschata]XP_022949976.1 zinc finger CCCH domain-containing protein 38 isoform X1 [Cucurbita moschata]XP_022949977.1 zinc finger CCCH domain-containing protein 38 isoform X1 [Cucurbita moschata]XP_022949978.1 zinc finger CCCH domain-containing protein 38 isoform X1 [Cucurbita moschata]
MRKSLRVMSGSGRKHSSKWDLREDSHFEADSVQDHSWPGKESGPGWISAEIASDDGSKWSGMATTNTVSKSTQDWGLLSEEEPLPGTRASLKEDRPNKGYNKNMDGTAECDADKSYDTRMSPDLDGRRSHGSNLSDRNDWIGSVRGRSRSRSWSRSPPHGNKRDSGFHDRNRNRTRVSTQLCRDFTSGRCRRGNGCQFLHQDDQNLDDSLENRNRKGGRSFRSTSHDFKDHPRSGRSAAHCTDFVKGRCHRGASCTFSHDSAFHELSRDSPNDISRDRKNDQSKEAYFSRGEREPCSSSLVICKYFAAGSCRNGKNCKYSHHSQPRASPERKSSTDKWEHAQCSDGREQSWDGLKSSELASGSDFTQLIEDKKEQTASEEPRYTWPSDQKCDHGLNNESKTRWDRAVDIKTVRSNKNDAIPSKAENAGGCTGSSDPRGHRKWPSDDMEMSPDWHYPVQPSNHVVKGDCNVMQDSGSQTSTALAISHAIVQEALAKNQDIAIEPIVVDITRFQKNQTLTKDDTIASASNDNITIDRTAASHAEGNPSGNVGLGQRMAYHSDHPDGTVTNPKISDGNFRVKLQKKDESMPGINSGTTVTPNIVTNDQIRQITDLSASLAQYFGNAQPLPQLYASLNTHSVSEAPSFPYSDAPMGALGASMKTAPVIESSKQHDSALCNSLQLKKIEVTKTPQKSTTEVKGEVQIPNLPLSSGPCGISAEETLHGKPTADGDAIKEKNGDGDNENKTGPATNEDSQKIDTTENANGNDEVHDKKKSKDTKGIRAFKFALVEFVKELLKPTWKEGHISKDVYKTIVKKVVDKVTGSLQDGHIPQTQEKIDHYLSFSKSKLTKLVQVMHILKIQLVATITF